MCILAMELYLFKIWLQVDLNQDLIDRCSLIILLAPYNYKLCHISNLPYQIVLFFELNEFDWLLLKVEKCHTL